jgi:peptidoglycan/LPS O-acetylase OafA/YrhL
VGVVDRAAGDGAGAVTSADRQRLPALDGLRALAILGVLACHAPAALGGRWSTALGLWAPQGGLGVDAFFTLSGYLITTGLLRAHGTPGALAAFWRRRAARILPLYAFVLAVTVVVGSRWYAHDLDVYNPGDALPLFAAFLGNVPESVGPSPGALLGPLWSLAVEEQFYLAWPLVVLGCSRVRGAWCAGAGVVLAVAFRAWAPHGVTLYFATPARIDQLLVGALLAYAMGTPRGAALCDALIPRARMLAAVVIAACIATPGGVLLTHHREWTTVAPLAFALAVAIVIHALVTQGSRALEQRALVSIGRVSFAAYLCHEGTALVIRRALPRAWPLECRALAWGVAVWAAAWALTTCVERPVGRWIAGAPK